MKKFNEWKKLISIRANIEVLLLESADKYLNDNELETLNRLLLEKNYEWAGYVFKILSDKANAGYKEMHEEFNKNV